jgi:hypothetical protein
MAKKRSKKNDETPIRADILQVLRTAFPDEVVAMYFESEARPLDDLFPELRAKFLHLREAQLLYERGARPVARPWDDEEEDPPLTDDGTYSYCLLFLGLRDERFQYQSDDFTEEEDGTRRDLEWTGTIGCVVALSEVAPVAFIRFGSFEVAEQEGEHTIPDIDDSVFTLEGQGFQGVILHISSLLRFWR